MSTMVFVPKVTQSDKQKMEKRISNATDRFGSSEELAAWMESPESESKDAGAEGSDYTEQELKTLFDDIPVWLIDFEIEGKAEMASQHPGARKLRQYWTRGKGALKIRWGVSGDYNRCVTQLSKYVGPRAKGLCNVYHRSATGHPPGKGPHVG